jgi:hypothetical protein
MASRLAGSIPVVGSSNKQDVRAAYQSCREPDPPLCAPGVGAYLAVGDRAESKAADQLVCPSAGGPAAEATQPTEHREVFDGR